MGWILRRRNWPVFGTCEKQHESCSGNKTQVSDQVIQQFYFMEYIQQKNEIDVLHKYISHIYMTALRTISKMWS